MILFRSEAATCWINLHSTALAYPQVGLPHEVRHLIGSVVFIAPIVD